MIPNFAMESLLCFHMFVEYVMVFLVVWSIGCTIIIPFYFTKKFGKKKNPILDKHKKNLPIILNKLFWTYPVWLGHKLFYQA